MVWWFSVSGNFTSWVRGGLQDERSGLWWSWYQLIREALPEVLVIENSPLLYQRGLAAILQSLEEIGYVSEWQVLSSCRFGAPHMRRRLFIVSYTHSLYGQARLGLSSKHQEEVQETNPPPPREEWNLSASRASRSSDGISNRLERLECLGNSVSPIITEHIGRKIMRAFG